jgi:hypothetical protein
VFLGIGLVKVPADRAHRELLDIIQKGRKALSQLESIAFIDSRLIKVSQFSGFWIEINHVIEGLYVSLSGNSVSCSVTSGSFGPGSCLIRQEVSRCSRRGVDYECL